MRFATVATLFAAVVAAAPQQETRDKELVTITQLSLRKNKDVPTEITFKLDGEDAKGQECGQTINSIPSETVLCSNKDYRFEVVNGSKAGEFDIKLYHEVGTGFGYYGQIPMSIYCHAGGNGPNDILCAQQGNMGYYINAKGEATPV